MNHQPLQGAQYLSKGLSLVWKPGIKRFVFIPLLINFILLTLATIYAFNLISDWYTSLPSWLESHVSNPHWYIRWPAEGLEWLVTSLDWLLWPMIVIAVFILVFFSFGLLANWIAAPFNGLLSEAVETHLRGSASQTETFSWSLFVKDIPRLIGREWRKLAYFIPRALLCLILLFTPISPLVPIIWFIFNAWMLAIQYVDYPQDNHRQTFNQTLELLRQNRGAAYSFGLLVMLFTMIPVINIVLMPVAVAGATNFWFDANK
ncbi:MAG: sulfate transporter CysZ [Enterobacterales bacterium]|nr:sulfate transporter CysZ [Enterobacterales bacterium]